VNGRTTVDVCPYFGTCDSRSVAAIKPLLEFFALPGIVPGVASVAANFNFCVGEGVVISLSIWEVDFFRSNLLRST